MPGSPATDLHLVTRILQDDRAAAAALFVRHREAMQRVAGAILRGYPNRDELVAEAWQGFAERICAKGYRALAAWNGLDDPAVADGGIEPYLAQNMRFAAQDVQRAYERQRARERELGEDDDGNLEGGERGGGTDQHSEADLENMKALLALCVEALPPRQKKVIELRIRDLDHKQIAAALEITENNSRQMFHSAKESLRRCIERGGPDHDRQP